MSIEKIRLHLPVSLAVLAVGGILGSPIFASVANSAPLVKVESNIDKFAYQVMFESPPGQSAPGNSVAGGTRGVGLCDTESNLGLTLLLPENGVGRTVDSHPTFFFYVPDSECSYAEFSLFEEGGDEEIIYETRFAVPNAPGIAKVTIPEDLPALEVGKNYSWAVSLALDESSKIDVRFPYAYGAIERVEPDAELRENLENATEIEQATAYGMKGVWHETIAILAELIDAQPENAELKSQWEALLESEDVGLATIASEPFVECCTFEDSEEEL
ncbi:MAG: DUF928 domain-containing protein [Cyanobacteriota bacterium]|nr:DUF928 domain-containing protein [Cyanobacteriota bacterium]